MYLTNFQTNEHRKIPQFTKSFHYSIDNNCKEQKPNIIIARILQRTKTKYNYRVSKHLIFPTHCIHTLSTSLLTPLFFLEVSIGSGCSFWPMDQHDKRSGRGDTAQHCSRMGWHDPKEQVVLGLKKQPTNPPCRPTVQF